MRDVQIVPTFLFNRKTGEVFLAGAGELDELTDFLEKHHKDASGFEAIRPNGYVRIRALDKGHLDITTIGPASLI